MATVADLNVRLGLMYDGLDKGLNQVERKLRRSGERLSRLGSDLTLAISAPLAALGAASIKEAANLESLQLALEAQMGSAKAAQKEMELLRKEALKPGLGFEQAIRGSVQLQAVGFEAEFARKTLSAFGNALALAGKGKAELDGVATALTQISAKGKVSAEEINQIAERLPQIRTAMKAAFGTADTEVLQKSGISSEKFIAGIVEQLEKLPPATAGMKNSIENAGDAVKQFLGSLGAEINKTFNLTEKSEQLSKTLASAAEGFSNLDDSTKKTIISFGLAAVAAGPLIKVYGVLVSTGAQVVNVGRGILDGFKAATGVVLNAASAFGKLNLVMKASVIGAVIVGVTALYLAYDHFANSLSDAERAQQSVLDVTKRANEATIDERTKVMLLTDVLKDNTAKREDQQKALKELQVISPQYFGNLDLEKSKVGDINTALEKYTSSILRAAKAQAAFESIKEIEKQLQNLNESAKPTFLQQVGAQIDGLGNSALVAASEALSFAENMKEQKSALEAQRTALVGVIKENSNYVDTVSGANKTTEKAIDLSKKDASAKKEQKDAFDRYLETVNKAEAAQKKSQEVRAAMGVGPLESLPQAPGAVLPEAGQMGIGAITEGLTAMTDLTIAAGTGFTALTNTIATGGSVMEQAGYAMAAAFEQAGASGEASFGKMALAAVGAAAKIIRTNIQIAVTQAALSALRTIPFPFNIAAAAAAGALASGLFNKLISSVGIPALAEGAVISSPTTALMGEYPGARSNPEIVSPESKMRDVFKGVMRRYGGMNGGVLSTRLSGRDILFVLEQAQYDSRRTRGKYGN